MSDRRHLRAGPQRRAVAARLRQAYEAGASVVDLAAERGISRSSVQRLLWEADTVMRPPGVPAAALRPATATDLDALVDSWLQETDRAGHANQ